MKRDLGLMLISGRRAKKSESFSASWHHADHAYRDACVRLTPQQQKQLQTLQPETPRPPFQTLNRGKPFQKPKSSRDYARAGVTYARGQSRACGFNNSFRSHGAFNGHFSNGVRGDFPIQNRVGALFYDGASLRGRSASCLLGCGRLPTVNRL